MTRKIVIALLAATVALAAQASAASAELFRSESEPTYYTAINATEFVLTTTAGTVKCVGGSLTGSSSSTGVATLTLNVLGYSGCKAFGQNATFTNEGCRYVFLEPQWPLGIGNLTIECEANKELVFKANTAGCTVRIGAQAGRISINHDNEGSGSTRYILSKFGVEAIDYTASGGICGSGTNNNGKIAGNMTLRGYNNEAHTSQTGIWVS